MKINVLMPLENEISAFVLHSLESGRPFFLLQVAFFPFESRLQGTSQVRNLFPSETRSVRPLEGKTRTLDGRGVRV